MKSPFPGMDPYLEAYWRDVRTRLVTYVADEIGRELPAGLVARVEEDVKIDFGEEGHSWARPDVQVAPDSGAEETERAGTGSALVAEPLVLVALPPRTERRVTIVDPVSGDRIVTAIEVLSPTNKTEGQGGRDSYLRKQRDYSAGGINLVEIDLVRKGEYVLLPPWDAIPKSKRALYNTAVFRATRPDQRLLYPMSLRERLPAIRIPLRPTDNDVVLDLQQVVDQCYERGRYYTINYQKDPDPPLPPDDAQWADQLLRQKGLRK